LKTTRNDPAKRGAGGGNNTEAVVIKDLCQEHHRCSVGFQAGK